LQKNQLSFKAVNFIFEVSLFPKMGNSKNESSGLRLIYKKIYGKILRIDYGFNIQNDNQREIVIGLRQYF